MITNPMHPPIVVEDLNLYTIPSKSLYEVHVNCHKAVNHPNPNERSTSSAVCLMFLLGPIALGCYSFRCALVRLDRTRYGLAFRQNPTPRPNVVETDLESNKREVRVQT